MRQRNRLLCVLIYLYGNCLQDNVIGQKEYDSMFRFSTKYVKGYKTISSPETEI